MSVTLTCGQCGGGLGPDDRYCMHCGTEVAGGPSGLDGLSSLPPADSDSILADIVDRLRRATLGEFEIGRELGRGGMAAVFLAHEISLDRKVAIKVMSPGLLLSDGMVDRFRHEAITIAQLHHPHIVSVYSVRQAEGLHFFVMRYVEGRSLEEVIQSAGRLSLPMVRSILHQVGAALAYAHRARIIHRDIKPANILIDAEGNAVVTDFGIAKAAMSPTRTVTGALVGTPAYMSPEQCSGAEVSGATDQYSLGAVAYEMLTGVPPFTGSTLTVMQAHVERSPPPLRPHCPDCPPEVEAAVLRMLAKDPAARWPRIPEALAALGAKPLADDDPYLAELRSLVACAGPHGPADSFTPTSPVPHTRRPSGLGDLGGRTVGSISVLPPPSGLEVGDSFVLVAMVRGQHGTRLPPNTVIWSSDPPGILRFDSGGGVATAVAPGTTLLTAKSGEHRAHLRVEIAPPRADDIVIGPVDHGVAVGDEIRLEAVVRDKRGQPVDRAVTWRAGDPSIASVAPDGALVGLAQGFTRVTASLDDAQAAITIPVLPARVAAIQIDAPTTARVGEKTLTVKATPVDRWGRPLADRPVLWSSSDVRVALVTVGGTVHALRPGSVVLTASCEGVSESVRLSLDAPRGSTQAPLPVAPAEVPAPHRRLKRRRRGGRLAAVLAAVVAGGALSLVSRRDPPSDTAEVALSAPAAAVEDTMVAVSEVSAGEPSVVITRRPARALRPEGATRLVAEVRDRQGRVLPDGRVSWRSTAPSVARVNPVTGWVRAVRPGRAAIVAEGDAGRDTVVITVRPAEPKISPVGSISIAPRAHLNVGDTVRLEAIVLDANGGRVADAAVGWQSSNLAIVEIDPQSGEVRALEPGRALVFARSGGESALAELTVLPAPVAVVRVRGVHPMAVGETLALWAEVTGARNAPLHGRPVAWRSSKPSVASVDSATGLVTAHAPGTTEIAAAAEGKLGRARISVRLPDVPDVPPVTGSAAVQAGAMECYDAVRARDVARLAEMYRPETEADQEKLEKLSRILRTAEWSASVGEPVNGERQVESDMAAMEFSFLLTWKDAFGGRVSSRPTLRVELSRKDGDWAVASCRVVGSPRL